MTTRSVLLVIPAAHRDTANLVFAAMGRGPDTFSAPCSPTGSLPATHYIAHDASMSAALAAEAVALPDNAGTLPEIAGTWGQGGAPAQGLARAACAVMAVGVASNISGAEHRDGILSGLVLQPVRLRG